MRSEHDAHAALEASAEEGASVEPTLGQAIVGEIKADLPLFVTVAALVLMAAALLTGRLHAVGDAEPAAPAASAASAPVKRVRVACQLAPDGRCLRVQT